MPQLMCWLRVVLHSLQQQRTCAQSSGILGFYFTTHRQGGCDEPGVAAAFKVLATQRQSLSAVSQHMQANVILFNAMLWQCWHVHEPTCHNML